VWLTESCLVAIEEYYVAIQLKIATAYPALVLDLKNAVHKLLHVEYAFQFYCEMWKIICAIYK